MGIFLNFEHNITLLLNVYAICDYRNDEALTSYLSTLSEISYIRNNETFTDIVIAGDFNCDPSRGRFFDYFSDTLDSLHLHAVDILRLPSDSHTYVSRNEACSTSWLDHVVTSNSDVVDDIDILYGVSFEDHIPVKFSLRLPIEDLSPCTESGSEYKSSDEQIPFIMWKDICEDDIIVYNSILKELLSNYLPVPPLSCSENFCDDYRHKSELDHAYQYFIQCIKFASEVFPSYSTSKKAKHRVGWNDSCKCLYSIARDCYKYWNSCGSPRTGVVFQEMKDARRNFRNAFSYCKKNEINLKKRKMVESFQDKNVFWKNVKSLNRKATDITNMDGVSKTEDIIRIF